MTLRRLFLGLLAAVLGVGCAGLFTRVPLPPVSSTERRAALQTTLPLSADQLELLCQRNFYSILYDEAGVTGESREQFIARQIADERVPPTWVLSISRQGAAEVATRYGPSVGAQLEEAVGRAQAPLARRLNRVASRVAAAAGRSDLVFQLDPEEGLNAGAAHGFDSRNIFVGPKMILLAETEDGLAWVLGHEIAHITNGHTTSGHVRDLLVGTLQFTGKVALAVANAAVCTQGSCMTGQELRDSMAATATIIGVTARGALTATGVDRDEEREADYYGLQYAVRAGYRPDAGAMVIRRLLALDRGAGSSFDIPFLRDHPTSEERLVRVEKWARGMGASGLIESASAGSRIERDVSQRPTIAAKVEPPTTTAPAPEAAARPTSRTARPPGAVNPPSTCWQIAGADSQRCTTCCDEAGCRSRCEQGDSPAQVAASARAARSCWNVDSRIGGKAAVCTTCCTASVSCSTTCARMN